MMSVAEVRNALKSRTIGMENSFSILQAICALASQSQGKDDSKVQELVLRALDQREAFKSFDEILNGLVRHFGLFPYLTAETLTVRDAIAREFHRPQLINDRSVDVSQELREQEGPVFHRVQAEVFRRLLDGDSVVLSAPTSFGKSSLVDALIEVGRFSNVVIVVPTIALIDETRRRLSRFRKTHKVITHASQELADRNVFVVTQERAVEFPDLPDIDLFVLDEFYKLDPREDAQRAMTLNHAFYKLTKKAKQFYLLGPNIQSIPHGFPERFKCQFVRTDFATVVTELIPVSTKRSAEFETLIELCMGIDGPTLIYCASPNRARKVTELLAEALSDSDYGMEDAADWAGEHYHHGWSLVKGLNRGIGMHHGRMPRSIAQLCVRGFNEGKLKFLVCTSTLIEGVNTKAKNVIVFDNKIAKQKYDFFTFNNIRGRSGRMFKHFIGNVYIFNDPPQEDLPLVDVPVFSQKESNTSESLLIQLDDRDLEERSRRRLEPYMNQRLLSLDVLRQNAGIEPEDQLTLARHLAANDQEIAALAWRRFPTWDQLAKLCETIWQFFVKSSIRIGGVSSGRHLAFKINQIRTTGLKELIDSQVKSEDEADEAVESVLEFVRQWPQYRFPKLAMAVCRVQQAIATARGRAELVADYSVYVGQVENLFSDAAIVALDEYGLPLPLAKKLESALYPQGSLDTALKNLLKLDATKLRLSVFERELVDDVRRSI